MATGLSFDDLIPKGGSNAQPAGMSFDDLIPKERGTAQKAYDNLYNTFVAKPTEAYKSAVQDFNQSAGEDLKAEGEALDAPNPLEYVAAKAQNLPHKLGTALKAVAIPFAPVMAGARELAQQTVSPGANPDQYYADLAAGKVQEEPVYGPNRRAAAAGFVAENAVGLAPIPGAAEARVAKVAQVERATTADRAAARFAAEDAARPPAPPPEVVAEPVMAAGTVDDAIAAAKEAVSAPAPRIIDFSDLIPAREAPRVEPAALPEPVRTAEPLPSTLPREAAVEPPQALSFDDLVGQEPITVRPAEPQPGTPVPSPNAVPETILPKPMPEPSAAVDGEVFRVYNNLAARHATYSRWVQELTERRDADPRIKAAADEINATLAKAKGKEEYLTKRAAARVAELRGYISDFLAVDSPDMARVKNVLAENYNAMLEMGPEVKAARQAAREQAAKIYGDKANVISADELWQAGVKDTDAPGIAEQKLSEFRLSPNADKLASEHGVEIASDAKQLPSSEYAELRRHGYEPIESAGARVEELAGIPKAAQESGTVPEVSSASNGLGRAPAAPRELPVADHPEELTAKAPEGVARPAPVEPTDEPGALEFKTSKGSTYRVNPDGTTTRNKAARSDIGHEGQQGPQPKSERTYYVTDEQADALSLFQTEGDRKAIAQRPDGSIGVKYLDGPNAGKFERRTVVTPATEPAIGLTPVELWKSGERVHFGNKISEVSPVAPKAPRQISTLKPIKGTGEERARAINEEIYNVGEEAPQIAAADRLVATDYERAVQVAMRQKNPPAGVHPEFVYKAVKERAIRDGDFELQRKLSASKIATEATTMGQRIAAWRGRDPLDPIENMRGVDEARAEALKARKVEPQKATDDAVRVMRKEVRKTATRQSWEEFIGSIVCGY